VITAYIAVIHPSVIVGWSPLPPDSALVTATTRDGRSLYQRTRGNVAVFDVGPLEQQVEMVAYDANGLPLGSKVHPSKP